MVNLVKSINTTKYRKLIKRLQLPFLRFDPTFIFALISYDEALRKLKRNSPSPKLNSLKKMNTIISFEYLSRFATKRSRRQRQGIKAQVLGAKSIKNLSVDILKTDEGYVPNKKYLLQGLTLLFTETGRIDNIGICPSYLEEVINKEFKRPVATTHHIIRGKIKNSNQKDDLYYYLIALFNTSYGKLILRVCTYGALQPELELSTLSQMKIPILSKQIIRKISQIVRDSIEDYEKKAWLSFFEMKKLFLKYSLEKSISIVFSQETFKNNITHRLDPKFHIANKMVERLEKEYPEKVKIIRVKDWFTVSLGNAPRDRRYKNLKGKPYVSIDSIDENGLILEENLYHLPSSQEKKYSKKTAKNFDILLVKDGVGSIGKVGLNTYDNIPVMQGIAILRPKSEIDKNKVLYSWSVLRTKLLHRVINYYAYGTTGQLSLSAKDIEHIPIPLIEDIFSKVTKLATSFVLNFLKSKELKDKAIQELENILAEAIK